MARTTGGEAVVRALEAHGVDAVFGIPGTHILAIYRHLARSRIRHVTPRHEQGAGFAADGFARAGGRPGVCVVTTGPGVTNVATAAAQAYSDSVPVLVISAGIPRALEGKASGYLHEAKDQRAAMDALLAWSHRASSPADAAEAIARAFAEFASRRPRPVHVEVPVDVLEGEGELPPAAPRPAGPPAADPAAVERAARLLREARRPAIVAGGGARRAAGAVRRLAERLHAPVLTTANGKGVLPEDHPLALGAGIHLAAARHFLAECDAVLAVGTELAPADLWHGPLELPRSLIRIDIDPGQLHKNYPAAVAVLGDAGDALEQLLSALDRAGAAPAPDGAARAAEARAALAEEAARLGRPWLPLIRRLRRALPREAVLSCDTAMACYYGALYHFPVYGPGQFLYPAGYGTLGYALPAAIGARLARPDRPVAALSGDGGFLFTAAELLTAVEQRLPIPVVISNNRGYGEIRREMEALGIAPLGVDLVTPDFAALAEACGAHGVRLRDLDELAGALERALAADRPTLIEVDEAALRRQAEEEEG